MVHGFLLGWAYVADGLEQSSMIKPVEPLEGRHPGGVEAAPRPAVTNDLGLVGSVIVSASALSADRHVLPRSARQARSGHVADGQRSSLGVAVRRWSAGAQAMKPVYLQTARLMA